MALEATRASAYGEAPHAPKATGTKTHGTHSAASSGGAQPFGHNPAMDVKHPNYCPNCGEPMASHISPAMGSGGMSFPEGSAQEEAGESPAFEKAEDEGAKEMSGSPAYGSKKRTKGTKLKKK